ncbi:MAG: DUF4912 domain-containing protein [Treponema sp.]|nr:DUF4912 domain-containing protein [Treponema sp.]
MKNNLLTLAHLETLSSQDLIALADDWGIDIPDNLNRRFIIGELLEVAQDSQPEEESIQVMNEDEDLPVNDGELPQSFNETQISVLLRNPAWAFVYWDISSDALKKIEESTRFKALFLRVSYFEDEETITPVEYYDLQIKLEDREQYILLKSGMKYLRVDLVAALDDGTFDGLTVSSRLLLPETPAIFSKAFPGQEVEMPEILKVSGMKKLLKSHYEKYRQSFVE